MSSTKQIVGVRKRILWEEPPAKVKAVKPKHVSQYDKLIDTLRSRPGQWGMIAQNITAQNLTRLRRKYPDIEFTYRGTSKKARIYGRLPVAPATEEFEVAQLPPVEVTPIALPPVYNPGV
jgi:hypothetical protein